MARHLIDEDLAAAETFSFDDRGRLVGFGAAQERAEQTTAPGIPFMTSGCPDETGMVACNRPFGDCTPATTSAASRSSPTTMDLVAINGQLSE